MKAADDTLPLGITPAVKTLQDVHSRQPEVRLLAAGVDGKGVPAGKLGPRIVTQSLVSGAEVLPGLAFAGVEHEYPLVTGDGVSVPPSAQ